MRHLPARLTPSLLLTALLLTGCSWGEDDDHAAPCGGDEPQCLPDELWLDDEEACEPHEVACNDVGLPAGVEPVADTDDDGLGGFGGVDDPDETGRAVADLAGRAQALVGVDEAALAADVRVDRRGAETFTLTDDLVPGRLTVELDETADGRFVVTVVTLETAEGTERFGSGSLPTETEPDGDTGAGGFPAG